MGKETDGVLVTCEFSPSECEALKAMFDEVEAEGKRIQRAKAEGGFRYPFQILPHRNLGLILVYDSEGNKKLVAEPLYDDVPTDMCGLEYARFTIDKERLHTIEEHNAKFADVSEEEIIRRKVERTHKSIEHWLNIAKECEATSIEEMIKETLKEGKE